MKQFFECPVPKPRKLRAASQQAALVLDDGGTLSTAEQQYNVTSTITSLRRHVDEWRASDPWGIR